jgi:membrane protein required for colicin V production
MEFLDNKFDLALLVIVAVLSLRGFLSGFLKEFSSTIGIIGGIYLSSNFSYLIENFINKNVNLFINSNTTGFVSFLIGIIIFMLATRYTVLIIANLVKYEQLTPIDRIAGVMISLIKNFLFISIIMTSFNNIDFMKKGLSQYTKGSKILPITLDIGNKLIGKIINKINRKNNRRNNINLNVLPKITY